MVQIGRAEAARGVSQRLAATVEAYPGLRVVPVPAQFLRMPSDSSAGGQRVLRGGRLPEADDEVFEVVGELWRSAGSLVTDAATPDGRVLSATDPAGYVISLARYGIDDPVLTVASPPFPAPFLDRGLAAGLLAGVGVGCLGPCVARVGPSEVIPGLASYWGWVPIFALVVIGSLWFPETRRFGIGLAATGLIIGVAVAAIFS
ncbi:hypothetical protein [Paractinoplanes globisporus]|uniref:Uncharacterized protein n=1 Tax=Paractinoplanes globisporus TaxID=113565 RepID=A0ABW6WW67_9ACTN|nr:hypothetical protein [Actinoplanes globisporus]